MSVKHKLQNVHMQTLGATDDLDLTTAAVVRNNRAAAAACVAAAGSAPKKGAQEALRRLERLMAPNGTHLEPALETRLLDGQKQEILGNRCHVHSWKVGAVALGLEPRSHQHCVHLELCIYDSFRKRDLEWTKARGYYRQTVSLSSCFLL